MLSSCRSAGSKKKWREDERGVHERGGGKGEREREEREGKKGKAEKEKWGGEGRKRNPSPVSPTAKFFPCRGCVLVHTHFQISLGTGSFTCSGGKAENTWWNFQVQQGVWNWCNLGQQTGTEEPISPTADVPRAGPFWFWWQGTWETPAPLLLPPPPNPDLSPSLEYYFVLCVLFLTYSLQTAASSYL